MSIKFQFKKRHSNLFSYHYVPTERTIVHAQWQNFIDDPTAFNVPDELIWGWILREETAVYLGFAWALAENLECFVIPNFYSDDAAKRTGISYEPINWEYKVEVKPLSDVVDDKGFLPAPSCVQNDLRLSNWKIKACQRKSGFFHVKKFTELAKIHEVTLMDAFSEISLFCLKKARQEELVTFLSSEKKPDLSNFLNTDEVFIDIVLIIDDIGCPDSILIKSPNDISAKIHSISEQFEQSVSGYEDDSKKFKTSEQALFRLQELAYGRKS
jgi:hypothetical protein